MDNQVENVIVVGSGPAGYTAALYAARADLKPLLLAGPEPGGQLMITTDVENYPGFPDGVLGPPLMELFQKQAERFGARVLFETVSKADLSKRPFRIWSEGAERQAQTLIIATGASAKWLGLESEQTFGGHGVSACATCDGFFFRGKEVLVVGGGDTAMEEASYLTRHCSKVLLAHRRQAFRASKIMQDRVLSNPKIEVLWNTEVDEILGECTPIKKVTGVRLRDAVSGATKERPIDGVFVAIGHRPNSSVFAGFLDMDAVGYVKTQAGSTRTNVPGVMAAMDAERFLEAEGPHA
ncbi:MAG: thioredoxin-disulfide reductase [Fimbriimonas ginsengisoli]|nr:thioredoxin-disulfide reductase [Fimbriimonas ginsengisoli]